MPTNCTATNTSSKQLLWVEMSSTNIYIYEGSGGDASVLPFLCILPEIRVICIRCADKIRCLHDIGEIQIKKQNLISHSFFFFLNVKFLISFIFWILLKHNHSIWNHLYLAKSIYIDCQASDQMTLLCHIRLQ